MAIKRRRGTPRDVALAQPFIGPALPRMPGLPFGPLSLTKGYFQWDPWWMHRVGVVNSSVYLFTGNKGQGKSAFEKAIALRFGARRGRDLGDGNVRPMRILFNDRKLEGEEPEFISVTRFLQGTVVPLNRHASINVFDPKMNMREEDLVDTAINIVENVSALSPLPRFQNLALQTAVWRMMSERPDQASPEYLEALLYSLNVSDALAYKKAKNKHITNLNIDPVLYRDDASFAASYLGEVLHGSYGGIFGGNMSLRDVLTDQVVLLDWTGVPDRARTLLSSMLWKWRDIAQRMGDHDLIPDMYFSDEDHSALENLMYARFMSASLKKVRSQPTAYFMSTQHETDLFMSGDEGSELRNLTTSISNSIGGRFVSRQPDDPKILDFYRGLGFSELDVNALPNLPKGHFYFHAQGYPAVPFKLDLTPIELELSDTTSASRSMTVGLGAEYEDGAPRDIDLIKELMSAKG